MNIALIICCLIGLIYGLRKQYKINPFTIFFGLWLLITVLASLGWYELLPSSNRTYGVMLVGCAAFFVGGVIGEKFLGRRNRKKQKREVRLNYKILYVLAIVSVVVYLMYFGQTTSLLLQGYDLGHIRQIAQQGDIYNNQVLNALRILVVFPVTYLLATVVPTDMFFGKKDKVLLALTILTIMLKVITDGSRTALVWFAVCMLICYLYQRKRMQNTKKQDRKTLSAQSKAVAVVVGLVIIAVLAVATLSRSGENTVRFTYYYFAMEPKMLENWMANADQLGIMGWGMASLNGFFFAINYIISHIIPIGVLPHFRVVYDFLEGVGTDWQTITTYGTRANSYTSVFFTLYVDGRIIGVILGMVIFGLISGRFYKKATSEDCDALTISIYNYVMVAILLSFIQFPLKNVYNCLALTMLMTISYNNILSLPGKTNKKEVESGK